MMVDKLKEPSSTIRVTASSPTSPTLLTLSALPLSLFTMNVIHGSMLVIYNKLIFKTIEYALSIAAY